MVLAGNKCDQKDNITVDYAEIEAVCREWNMKYFQVSAKENFNISECFEDLMQIVGTKRL